MIFVGKRQVGKTHRAIQEVVSRCKSGDTIGIISYNSDSSNFLKTRIEKLLSSDSICVKVINLNEIKDVDHVLIDELDKVLGSKCVCSTGGVIKLERYDLKYNEYIKNVNFDNYTYKEENNNILGEYIGLEDGSFKHFKDVENNFYSNKIKIKDSNLNGSLCWGTTSHILGDFKVNNYELYTKEYVEKEKEKYKVNYKAYLELELELKTISTEIENTPKENIKHKIAMLNKKNKIEIKLAELESKL